MQRTLARRYLLMPRYGSDLVQLLLLPSPEGWTLPFVDLERHYYPFAAPLAEAVQAAYGVDVALLRAVYRHTGEPGDYVDRVLAVEVLNRQPWAPPPGGCWVTGAELGGLDLAVPEHRAVMLAWLDEAEGRAARPANRSPWAMPGWLPQAVTWIDGQLARLGIQRSGPVEQVKSWSISCLLKLPTSAGELWFKAVPAFFPTEVGVTAALAVRFPGRLPRVAAVDLERRWMLTYAYEGGLLEDELDVERWEEAFRSYADMQVRLAGSVDDLLAAGCNDRRPAVMFAQFEQLLADDAFLSTALRPDEIVRLRALLPELKDLSARLEATGIPYTLEHGDLNCRNVSRSLCFFDWSDACIAHPFFSLWYFLGSAKDASVGRTVGLEERLTAAYLAPWAEFATPAALRAGVGAASRLANVHYALSYYCYIEPLSDESWADVVAEYLRALL